MQSNKIGIETNIKIRDEALSTEIRMTLPYLLTYFSINHKII